MGILNVLFVEPILCAVLVSSEIELQTHFYRSQDILFIGCDISSEVHVVSLHLRHVSLGFNVNQ